MKYPLKLGNGELPVNAINKVELPINILINDDLINEVNGSCTDKGNYNEIRDRGIFTALNKEVSKINIYFTEKLSEEYKLFYKI